MKSNDPHNLVKQQKPDLIDAFEQFMRNGRWGTCGSCPTGSEGRRFPEMCDNTARTDHHLDLESLCSQYQLAHQDAANELDGGVNGKNNALQEGSTSKHSITLEMLGSSKLGLST